MSDAPTSTRASCGHCKAGTRATGLADRSATLSAAVAGLGLWTLPKCPLCLGAWAAVTAALGCSAQNLVDLRLPALVLLSVSLAYGLLRAARRLKSG